MHFMLSNLNGSTVANRPYPTCAFTGSRDGSAVGRQAFEEQKFPILAPQVFGP